MGSSGRPSRQSQWRARARPARRLDLWCLHGGPEDCGATSRGGSTPAGGSQRGERRAISFLPHSTV
eukprot:2117544-Alexandrium_andersonii.AAC.1